MNINDLKPEDYEVVDSKPLNINDLKPDDYQEVHSEIQEDLFTPGPSVIDSTQFTDSKDNAQTIVQGETLNPHAVADVSELTAMGEAGLARGAIRPVLGVAYLGEGVYNKLTNEQSKITDDWIKENEAIIKDKGLEGPALVGEIASNILLSGISAGSSAAGVAVREASIAGASSIGADRDSLDTGIAMMLGGGIGGGVQAVLNKLDKTQVKKLYDYMLEQYNVDPITAEKNFVEWRKATGESNSIENKVKSLVDGLGDEGATLKREIAHDPMAVKNLNRRVKETKKSVEELAKSNFNVENFADDLDNAYTDVSKKYGEVKEQISSVPVDKRFEMEPWEALDEATAGDVKELRNLIGEDNPYINSKDLVEAMPIINKLIRRSKGKTLHKWSEVSKAVDTQLRDVLTESQYKLWKETNTLYSKMASVRESKLGNLIATAKGKSFKGNPKSTPEEVMAKLSKVNAGDDTFTNIVTLVGKDKTEELEKGIISSALKEDKAWKTISKNLRNKGFVTAEGKRLQNIVNEFQTVFKTDDAMRVLNTNIGHEGASIATTAEGKAAVWVINKLANMIRKHVPFSAEAKHLRKLDTLEEVLRSPTLSAKLSETFEKLPQSVKDDIGTAYVAKLQEEMKKEQAIKHIDYKPEAKITGDTNVKPLYSTPEGTVGTDATKVTLHDAQTKMVKEALGKDYSNDIINQTSKLLNSKRFNNVIKSTSDRMKADELSSNMTMLKKTIKSEVDQIVKRINKDYGVKLPPKEVEKIYKLKVQEMLKDCK